MTSEPRRDPVTDPLLTSENSALVVIDFQPNQLQAVASIDHDLLTRNIVSVARLARTFGLPIVLSTVNVRTTGAPPTLPELKEVLADDVELDRTSINAWEDLEFRRAVQATGRKKLIMAALWSEMCLAFLALDALAGELQRDWARTDTALEVVGIVRGPPARRPTPPSRNKSHGERCQR